MDNQKQSCDVKNTHSHHHHGKSIFKRKSFRRLLLASFILGAIGQWLLAWWVVFLISFIGAAIVNIRFKNSFLACGIAVGLIWLIFPLIGFLGTDNIIHKLLKTNVENLALITLLMTIAGIVIGGLGGGLGSLLRKETDEMEGQCCPTGSR